MRANGSVNVAIIGVGNCASSLVQGVEAFIRGESAATLRGEGAVPPPAESVPVESLPAR